MAQEQQDKERLELAKRQFEQILASDGLINAYIANNIIAKYLSGLQKIRYEQGDFRGYLRWSDTSLSGCMNCNGLT
ncbi:hypothetical protein [Moraxella catarrhalis]|uniref:hypothetical protein n=1 Tax=Moraxella catarrhalis TaxID=480 RepID=UPI00128B999E|nr:hypothetical protein [Moraxella catarrhalis]MPX14652.1 hypothetical protein [Moraxella catarrhalis]